MQTRNLPQTGSRYWIALCIASVLGANLGDFISHDLHLGHARGLAPLGAIFALILLAERRTQGDGRAGGSDAFYWIAIVTTRTAATNLGDLATHDFGWSSATLITALSLVLAGLVARAGPVARDAAGAGMPATGMLYWISMLTAGTLGTVAGDYVSGGLGLGTGFASAVLFAVVAALLPLRALPGLAMAATYWLAVVAIRTAGTTMGDYIAFRHGINLGLPACTLLGAAALAGVLTIWPPAYRLPAARKF